MSGNIYSPHSVIGTHLRELERQAEQQRAVMKSSVEILGRTQPHVATQAPVSDGWQPGSAVFTTDFGQLKETAKSIKSTKSKKARPGFWARLFGMRAR
ncbi:MULTISPECIES: hypothetical protein [unclassified Mesorhizobium]|uniref:hypothetical protein n=1 Tax=unclassified Mesorhizobium TaxID=325217 RepID=UPI002415C9B9|nr:MULTISPECIES: hypothetical protein [unclassified Mesorhizobium]MDG4901415.1 hypothetical protein [Mesorhizobium sp. WSM4962]MDG4918903.1 hypothetical protein [Mesorhizobium sp. WSM4989]